MRYEYYSQVHETNNLNVQFDINTAPILPVPPPSYNAAKTNFGPRVGLSYSPASKTAIHGGFGIFYGPGQTEDLLQPIESDLINTVVSGGAFPIDLNAVRQHFIANDSNRYSGPSCYSH